ncbi:hypothetical protein F0562_025057 [Nyssa sinensis]|uniref:Uncharacterized protein n=1 Tax=Nyssa sinensis TaxID=561372 RepID=A0A5J5BEG0_9ASTE|nr:hypothetical protein F0562_025057 [Nyssa sinensis]
MVLPGVFFLKTRVAVAFRKSSSQRRGKLLTRIRKDSIKSETIEESDHRNEHVESPDFVIGICKKLDEVLHQQGGHSIFEVPSSLQKLEPDAFIPHVVSIGPYHRNEKRLQGMEKHKWRVLGHVLRRTKYPIEFYRDAILPLEMDTRNCYDKLFKKFSSSEFVEMMLLDACFILELLNVAANGIKHCGYKLDDPLFTTRGISPFIQRDLLMLENQLPLFVLNRLFPLTWGQSIMDMDVSVDQLALKFFDSVLPGISKNLPKFKRNERPRLHLLDVVRQALRPSSRCVPSQYKQPFQTAMHSVTSLRGTSVVFKKKDSTKFTDIEFSKGVLFIPPLVIHDSTKSIFLNLMVFEQYYPRCSNDVTSDVSFMDGLINSAKDVEYLYDKGIIDHGLGSNEDVANLFNNLQKDIVFDTNDSYLAKVSHDLDEHFNKKWHSRLAVLKHEYLKDPWKVISLGAASFLIFLTLAQTTYTILGYHHPLS